MLLSILLRSLVTLMSKASKLPFLNQMTQVVCLGSCVNLWTVIDDFVDVTEIIGSGKVDMGFKAMIHTLAVSTFHISE